MRFTSLALAMTTAVMVASAVSAKVPNCTPDQMTAFKPYVNASSAVGCDLTTFKTCSDSCLAGLKASAEHAPECSSHATGFLSIKEVESTALADCEKLRADTAKKYTPQVITNAPVCTLAESQNMTVTGLDKCTRGRCSDDCLQRIETTIKTAPVCTLKAGGYTLGESKKYLLVDCLTSRNQDLSTNTVLNSIAMVTTTTKPEAAKTSAAPTASVALAASSAMAVVWSLV